MKQEVWPDLKKKITLTANNYVVQQNMLAFMKNALKRIGRMIIMNRNDNYMHIRTIYSSSSFFNTVELASCIESCLFRPVEEKVVVKLCTC